MFGIHKNTKHHSIFISFIVLDSGLGSKVGKNTNVYILMISLDLVSIICKITLKLKLLNRWIENKSIIPFHDKIENYYLKNVGIIK